jgi:hypothetical protein
MNVVAVGLFWAEAGITMAIISIIFLAFMYYSIPFFEERIPKIVRFARIFAITATVLSLFTGFFYGKLVCVATFLTNLCWIAATGPGFPYVPMLSPSLVFGIIGSVVSHISWMFAFVKVPVDGWTAIAYYFLFIWGLPVVMAVCLSVTDDVLAGSSGTGRKKKNAKTVWAKLLQWVFSLGRGNATDISEESHKYK